MEWKPHPWLPGVHPSPNLHNQPATYELGCLALDIPQLVEKRMQEIHDWTDKMVLDIGMGSGYYLSRFAKAARHVIGVEPHEPSRLQAMCRIGDLKIENTSIMIGSAEQLLLSDQSVEVAVARFAYFWGPGCEAGLKEVERVLKPGGIFFVIDYDRRNGTFASWLNRLPHYPKGTDLVETFWKNQGFTQENILTEFKFDTRKDLNAVIWNEFPKDLAMAIISEHRGPKVEIGLSIYWKTFD